MLNLPLAQDVAAIRFVGTYKYTSGWIDRIVASPFPLETDGGLTRGDVTAAPVQARYSDVNWEKLQGGRVTLLLKLGDNLSITPGRYDSLNQTIAEEDDERHHRDEQN